LLWLKITGLAVSRATATGRLIVDSPRPVDSAAVTLANEFGIRVNVEDPPYAFRDEVKDVSAGVSPEARIRRTVLIPKGGRLEIHFFLTPDGKIADIPSVLQGLADAANAQFPFEYRVETDGGWFTLVPTHSRDSLGRSIPVTPLLDRRVTIPAGTRSIAASAQLMTEALSAQTGLSVSCCQTGVAGLPWGMGQAPFSADDETARSVLKRLIELASLNQPSRDYWLERCDPLPSAWCFINLKHISEPISVAPVQTRE